MATKKKTATPKKPRTKDEIYAQYDGKSFNFKGVTWSIEVVDSIPTAIGLCVSSSRKIYLSKDPNGGYDKQLNEWLESREDWEASAKMVLRHEITHALFQSCGLDFCSLSSESWATNEEMVDFIAYVGPELFRVWKELELI